MREAAATAWFARHTHRWDDWTLADLREAKGETTVSLVVPARNEAATVGDVVTRVREALLDTVGLLDEIVVIDSDSTDDTYAVATDAGAKVFRSAEIRPDLGTHRGKGEAMWKSQWVTTGDLIVFMDADLLDWDTHFVPGLLGPLLTDPGVALVKGFYERPLGTGEEQQAFEGGRVTELVARPVIALDFPRLSGLVQPLAGEWAIRRSVFETLRVPTGYAVELAALIDVERTRGLDALAQVDLGRRAHRHQALRDLGGMATQILAAAEARRGMSVREDVALTQHHPRSAPARLPIQVVERPPRRLAEDDQTMQLGRHRFDADATIMMAIVNRTPDSFYDQGATWAEDKAMERVRLVAAQGAEMVDIGGIKAAPGEEIDAAEEKSRVVDFVARVREEFPHLVISVDTWRAEVGDAACAAGADVLNDAWGGADPELVDVAAQHRAGIICTHTGGVTPRTRPYRIEYDDVVAAAIHDTVAYAERAVAAGVDPHSVVIDPAHDFGKNTFHSLAVTNRLEEMVATGWPVLVSLSNKDFVGESLDLPVGDRLTGTLAATAVAALKGARIYRVHEVVETRQTVDMVRTIAGLRLPQRAIRGLM